MKKKNNLSLFQILKQGTSFRDKDTHSNIKGIKLNDKNKSKVDEEFNYGSDSESDQELLKYSAKRGKKKFQIDDDLEKKLNIRVQKQIDLSKNNMIHIDGERQYILSNFSKMVKKYGVRQIFVDNIKKAGFMKPSPVQMASIPQMMIGRNLISIAPTGSGKTLAFALPILHLLKAEQEEEKSNGIRAIILAPTFELSEQIYRELIFLSSKDSTKLRIRIISNLNSNHQTLNDQQKHIDIMVATPMTLLKLMKLEVVDLKPLRHFVMDEADKYFELGMKKQINQILEILNPLESIRYALFSATICHGVEELIRTFLKEPIKILIGGKNNVLSTIDQKLYYVGSEFGKMCKLKDMINNGEFVSPVLIFVQSKERAQDLLEEFQKDSDIKIENIHAEKSQSERKAIIQDFRSGKLWALICTDLMARGIDFKGVNLVINFDFPNTMINYIHRVGRTGRANRGGRAVTLYTDGDKPLLRSLGNVLKVSGCQVPEWIFELKKIDPNLKKRIEKFPIKRETISSSIEKNKDRNFDLEMKIRDKVWAKKLKKREEEGEEDDEPSKRKHIKA